MSEALFVTLCSSCSSILVEDSYVASSILSILIRSPTLSSDSSRFSSNSGSTGVKRATGR